MINKIQLKQYILTIVHSQQQQQQQKQKQQMKISKRIFYSVNFNIALT